MPRKRRRDTSTPIANTIPGRTLYDPDPVLPSLFSAIRSPLIEIEDRRLFSPDPIRDELFPSGFSGPSSIGPAKGPKRASGTRSRSPYSLMAAKPIMAFRVPKFVAVCVRRKQRREVLFALGKGGGGKRRPRRNNLSNVRC